MTTATAPAIPQGTARQQTPQVPALQGPRLPFHPLVEERFGIDRASWKALVEAIFPNAQSVESVVLALSYCKARRLDPFKRVVHIVPIWSKELGRMMDTVWPGIGELRTTAFRTGEYAGRGATVTGPVLTQKVGNAEVSFPEWAQVSVFRMVKGQRVEFSGPRVYWLETYAVKKRGDDSPNEMWENRPWGQLDKCAEAAALRAGFPEEIGSDYIPEEVQHEKSRVVDSTSKPSHTLEDLTARLETEQAPALEPGETMTEEGEVITQQPDETSQIDPLDGIAEQFAACELKGDARKLYDSLCGPDAETELADGPRALVTEWFEKANARIEGSRGSRSNKQPSLAGTT